MSIFQGPQMISMKKFDGCLSLSREIFLPVILERFPNFNAIRASKEDDLKDIFISYYEEKSLNLSSGSYRSFYRWRLLFGIQSECKNPECLCKDTFNRSLNCKLIVIIISYNVGQY